MRQVRPAGFEPATLGSEDRCAIQLRHGRVLVPNSNVCWARSEALWFLVVSSCQNRGSFLTLLDDRQMSWSARTPHAEVARGYRPPEEKVSLLENPEPR